MSCMTVISQMRTNLPMIHTTVWPNGNGNLGQLGAKWGGIGGSRSWWWDEALTSTMLALLEPSGPRIYILRRASQFSCLINYILRRASQFSCLINYILRRASQFSCLINSAKLVLTCVTRFSCWGWHRCYNLHRFSKNPLPVPVLVLVCARDSEMVPFISLPQLAWLAPFCPRERLRAPRWCDYALVRCGHSTGTEHCLWGGVHRNSSGAPQDGHPPSRRGWHTMTTLPPCLDTGWEMGTFCTTCVGARAVKPLSI
jgi:hypothetical protein